MIEKIPGTPRLDKLRVIHLFEADINLLKGIIWSRRLVSHAELFQALGEETWGCRKGRSAEECLLLKNFTYIMMRLTRTPGATFDNDAKACFDRIIMALAALRSRHLGVPTATCTMLTSLLEQVAYKIKTTIGISDDTYTSTPSNTLHGPGQGSKEGPALWLIISSMLIDILHKKSNGISFCDPHQDLKVQRTMDAFVDDTTAWINFFLDSFSTQDDEIIARLATSLTTTAQWWEELLTASGGKLELPKCFYYIIRWTFNEYGDPIIGPDPKIPIHIIDHTNNQEESVTQKPTSESHRTLGGMQLPCPGKGNPDQYQHYKEKTTKMARLVGAGWATRSEGHMLHTQYYTPSVRYGMCATVLTDDQLEDLQKPVINALLPTMGYNRNMDRRIVHGPFALGAVGMVNLKTLHGSTKLQHIIQQIRLGRPLGKKMIIALKWAQLHAGTRLPILEDPVPVTHLDEPYISALQSSLIASVSTLQIDEIQAQPIRRINDVHIMEMARAMRYTPRILQNIQNYRMYLRVSLLSEITNTDGTHILKSVRAGICSESEPTILWPIQKKPGKKALDSWRSFLKDSCTEQERRLPQPLGDWINTSDRRWLNYHCNTTGRIYADSGGGKWNIHGVTPIDRSNRRKTAVNPHIIGTTDSIPQHHVTPITIIKTKNGQLYASNPIGTGQTPIESSNPEIATTWTEFIAQLPEWERDLLQFNEDSGHKHFEIEHPNAELTTLHHYLCNGGTLYLVTDGGAIEPIKGSYGWVIASSTKILWTGRGYTRGYPINSHRAEGYGRLAGLVFLRRYIQYMKLEKCPNTVLNFCDNKTIVKSVLNTWDPYYKPGTTLSPNWDVLAQIHEVQSILKPVINIKPCEHVKGHQDRHKEVDELSWEAKLNFIADKDATYILDHYDPSQQPVWIPIPAGRLNLYLGDRICHSNMIKDFENRRNEFPMHAYLKKKYQWSTTTLHDIDWDAYKGARNQYPKLHATYVTKLCCRWLGTSQRVQMYDGSTNECVHCQEKETQQHVFQCKKDHRQQWRNQFIINLSKELVKLDTDPRIAEEIKEGLDSWLHTRPSTGHWAIQERIGWEPFFYGYMAAEWGHKQAAYLSRQTDHNKSAYTWAMKLIQFLWQQSYVAWSNRNKAKHSNSPTAIAQELRNLEIRLHGVYSLQKDVPHYDKAIFSSSVEEMLQLPIWRIKHWLSKYEPYMKERLIINIHQQEIRNKSIIDFFPLIYQQIQSNR